MFNRKPKPQTDEGMQSHIPSMEDSEMKSRETINVMVDNCKARFYRSTYYSQSQYDKCGQIKPQSWLDKKLGKPDPEQECLANVRNKYLECVRVVNEEYAPTIRELNRRKM